jgi:TonB-dependent starch-binding outer membrane protein SusC
MKKPKRFKVVQSLLTVVLAMVFSMPAFSQAVTISGTVTDQTGVTLPGTYVRVKGTQTGTVTDAQGKYSLSVNQGVTLVFSYVGYDDQEQVVAGSRVIDVIMAESSQMLDEVIVTGYQTIRRADLTGSVAVVQMEETKDVPSASILKAVQGKVTGLYITSDGSLSGQATNINIRGVNTLGTTSPLYIIDGVPTVDAAVFQSLNPNTIESFQILKDASASSIYGSRASNGVIIITTKSGKGQINVSAKSSLTMSNYVRRYDMANTDQYGRILWQGAVNDGDMTPDNSFFAYDWHMDGTNPVLDAVHPVEFIAADPLTPLGDTDWQSEVYRTGLISSNTISVNGGTERTNTMVDLSYYSNKGMVITTKYKRINLRVNNSVNFLDNKLKIGENIQLMGSQETPVPGDAARSDISLATDIVPVLPVYKTDGTYAGPLGAGFSDRANPVAMAEVQKFDKNSRYQAFGNVYAEATIIPKLTFKSSFGIEAGFLRNINIQPKWSNGFLSNTINSIDIGETQTFNWTWSNTANYQLIFGKSRAYVMVGMEAISNKTERFGGKKEGFAIDDPSYYYINAGTGAATNSGSATESKLLSYFGNLNYAFADKYLVTATIRYDGSSRFGQNHKFGLFPAASIGWVVTNENFMKGLPVLSNLKLKAGIGRVGNQEIGDYSRFPLWSANYGSTSYDFSGVNTGTLPSGYSSSQTVNDNLKWESTSEINLGLDFGFLHQSVTGSFDYFLRTTEDILTTPPYLGVIGEGGSQVQNGATMENKGWEFMLGYKGKAGEVDYSITGNFSHFMDEITYLPASVVRNYAGNTEKTIIGHSTKSSFGYITDGLFQSQAEVDAHATQPGKGIGRIRYKDLNDDGIINSLDQDWLGTTNPKVIYGITTEVSYKNLSLSIFIRGVAGALTNDQAKIEKNSFLGQVAGQNKGVSLLDAWTPTNTGSTIPMLSFSNNNDEGRASDYTRVNGAYIKLQTLQLSYTLPKKLLAPVKLSSVRIYALGENLLLIFDKKGPDAFTGIDPETPASNSGGYPKAVDFTFGIDVQL